MAAQNKLKIVASYCAARISHAGLVAASALIILSYPISTQAQDGFYEVETKYIFGFTEGSGVGLEGEKEFSLETIARIRKADGRYWASETKLEYEFTPNQYVQFELGPLVSAHVIKDVTDLDNRNSLAMSGFFGEMRYLVLERNSFSPLAITLSAEPEWHRIDETSGAHVTNLGLELKVNADLELITNRLFLGSNLLLLTVEILARRGHHLCDHRLVIGGDRLGHLLIGHRAVLRLDIGDRDLDQLLLVGAQLGRLGLA